MRKHVFFLLLLTFFICSLTTGNAMLAKAESMDQDAIFTIHLSAQSDSGKKSDWLNNAGFEVYDATNYVHRADQTKPSDALAHMFSGMTCQEGLQFVRDHGKDFTDLSAVSAVRAPGNEDAVQISLPRKSYLKNSRQITDAIYLFIMTPEKVTKASAGKEAAPMLVALPLYDPISKQELTSIHLYPKLTVPCRKAFFYKYGKRIDGSTAPIQGAEFAVYRIREGVKEYLTATGEQPESTWAQSDDPLHDSSITKAVSDEIGLVMINRLPPGDYYLEEVVTAPGFVIGEEAKAIPLSIPAGVDDRTGKLLPIQVNGQPEADFVLGEAPAAEQARGQPIVYNCEIPWRKLPDTGESKSGIFASGLVLISLGLFIWYRKRRCAHRF